MGRNQLRENACSTFLSSFFVVLLYMISTTLKSTKCMADIAIEHGVDRVETGVQ